VKRSHLWALVTVLIIAASCSSGSSSAPTLSCSITVAPLRFSVSSGGLPSTGALSITTSIPTCAWTATNLPDDWLFLGAVGSSNRSDFGHSVAGTGSGWVLLDSNAVANRNGPQYTSTIRIVWSTGEVDAIGCIPNCLAP